MDRRLIALGSSVIAGVLIVAAMATASASSAAEERYLSFSGTGANDDITVTYDPATDTTYLHNSVNPTFDTSEVGTTYIAIRDYAGNEGNGPNSNDRIRFLSTPASVKRIYVETEGGDDVVEISHTASSLLDLKVLTGTGNDRVDLADTLLDPDARQTDPFAGGLHIYGGEGDDELRGPTSPGTRPASAYGYSKQTHIYGGPGSDLIVGGDSHDYLYGGFTSSPGDGDDVIYGMGGDDVLSGQRGSDQLFGGDGDDRLVDGTSYSGGDGGGADLLVGGPGDDYFQVYGEGADTIDAGPGDDFISAVTLDNAIDELTCGSGYDRGGVGVGDILAPDCEAVTFPVDCPEESPGVCSALDVLGFRPPPNAASTSRAGKKNKRKRPNRKVFFVRAKPIHIRPGESKRVSFNLGRRKVNRIMRGRANTTIRIRLTVEAGRRSVYRSGGRIPLKRSG